jgi:hypothetical protein
VITDASYNSKTMSEDQTRQLIARQRSALYREGQFGDNRLAYVDETGAMRQGVPGPSEASSLRGQSPIAYDLGRANPPTAATPVSAMEASQQLKAGGAAKAAFEGVAAQANRMSASSPTDPSRRDAAPAAKAAHNNPAVAPIGTRPTGAPMGAASAAASAMSSSAKRSTTPMASSPGGWAPRGSHLWGQSSGLSSQASVWG